MAEQDTERMLPDVQKYFAALEKADQEYRAARDVLAGKFPQRHDCTPEGDRQYDEHRDEVRKADDAKYRTGEAAWEVLAASSDPLVKFIGENWSQYRCDAEVVLAALPATVEELDTLADQNGWCGVYEQFKADAIEAGALPAPLALSPAMVEVFEVIESHAGTASRRGKARIREALNALVQEAMEAAVSAEVATAVRVLS
ncbi:hypothetical protein [Streptomyces sp. N35]|uniref:hypothetical protein n=1 Tax=Streptomyces sp. N35 TaxID=2795730 RepID=UPI0018F4C05D|nr:hypothetical protein [Streptomyces sp. N35]